MACLDVGPALSSGVPGGCARGSRGGIRAWHAAPRCFDNGIGGAVVVEASARGRREDGTHRAAAWLPGEQQQILYDYAVLYLLDSGAS